VPVAEGPGHRLPIAGILRPVQRWRLHEPRYDITAERWTMHTPAACQDLTFWNCPSRPNLRMRRWSSRRFWPRSAAGDWTDPYAFQKTKIRHVLRHLIFRGPYAAR
jgi:hypothetical protein